MIRAALLTSLLVSAQAEAVGGMSPVPVVELDREESLAIPLVSPEEAEEPRHAALAIDTSVGVPSGAGVALAYRPFPWVRAKLGAAYNGIKPGGQAGLTFGWLTAPFTPTLSLEGGLFAPGDATGLAQQVGVNLSAIPAAHRFGYDYATAQLGLEFGWPEHFTFQVRGGLSYLRSVLHDTQATLRASSGDTELVAGDLTATAVTPSLSLGCVIYLF